MRETPAGRDAGRDRREIVVPGDMRAGGRGQAGGRASPPPRARKPAGPSGAAGAAAAFAERAGRLCLRYPGSVLGTLVGLGAALAGGLNAVGFQDGRHPAPILPTVEKAAEARPVAARPAPAREVRAEAPASDAPKPTPPRDAIADMIRSGETTASVTPRPAPKASAAKTEAAKSAAAKGDAAKGDAAKPEPAKADAKVDPAVARVQRALSRLGYGPLKDDGLMGPGTRAAIERFERDRKLPVKGEATGRTLRELTAKAAEG